MEVPKFCDSCPKQISFYPNACKLCTRGLQSLESIKNALKKLTKNVIYQISNWVRFLANQKCCVAYMWQRQLIRDNKILNEYSLLCKNDHSMATSCINTNPQLDISNTELKVNIDDNRVHLNKACYLLKLSKNILHCNRMLN